MNKKTISYADAGVNITVWNSARKKIASLVKTTYNKNVLGDFGHFGGMFSLHSIKSYKDPILVSSVDGVGTKLKIAAEMQIHNTVGIDIVNHCINDIMVLGARPLFFLDYIATGKLDANILVKILSGLSKACKEANCVLIGGETAEMPGMYNNNEYDIAGTIVGVVEKNKIIDGSKIKNGDIIIGLKSSGLHTNGYSLARKIVKEIAKKTYFDVFSETGKTFGEELLTPHTSYLEVLKIMNRGLIKGCAHITGGGFTDNIDRILPKNCDAKINCNSWTPLPIFVWLQKNGNIDNKEMYHTFNMGIGLVLIVRPVDVDKVLCAKEIKKFSPKIIGEIVPGRAKVLLNF
jgi:phosphoribosylformylglycinamidine cyclo-ligase